MSKVKYKHECRIDRDRLLATLGMPGKLDHDEFGAWKQVKVYNFQHSEHPWDMKTIVLFKSSSPGHPLIKSTKHRLHYVCECAKLIPTGRSTHHMMKCVSVQEVLGLSRETPLYMVTDRLKEIGYDELAAWWELAFGPKDIIYGTFDILVNTPMRPKILRELQDKAGK